MAGWLFGSALKSTMVTPERALRGRDDYAYSVPATHAVLGTPLRGPWPEGTQVIYLALGCFWGAEKEMWQLPGVVTTAAGYQGGLTSYPTYDETCTGMTGHAETVLVAYDPAVLPTAELLRTFWTLHDPTQGFRQGNDVGTQYRSAIYTTTPGQLEAARQRLVECRLHLGDRRCRSGHRERDVARRGPCGRPGERDQEHRENRGQQHDDGDERRPATGGRVRFGGHGGTLPRANKPNDRSL